MSTKACGLILVTFFIAVTFMDCSAEPEKAEIIRLPAVAGTFYPADSAGLQQQVKEHLDQVAGLPPIKGQIMALIVPHAGLVYSGWIAAYGYKLLENSRFDKVILCGPSHRFAFEGIAIYGPGVKWQTPLGMISCNDSLCRRLSGFDERIALDGRPHDQEHCLEVQLPYLQTVLKDFTIVPALMGRPSPVVVDMLADALASLKPDTSTIMIASTDWQHYHPASVGGPLDSLGMECIETLDPDLLIRRLAEGKTEACGGATAAAIIKAAVRLGANKAMILKYGDSGDITGDKSSVVSYVAAVIYREENSEPAGTSELLETEKRRLLQIARESIEGYLKAGRIPEFGVPEKLKRPGAAFVTLEKNHQLRGCIGYTEAIEPLFKTVSQCAIQAAVADPRFLPVKYEEMKDIDIEISVLTPLQRVGQLDEIKVGRDGLMIFKGAYRGLLLPQVATDYGWSREEFLQQTCRKAGLPADAYLAPDAEIYRFQALIFAE